MIWVNGLTVCVLDPVNRGVDSVDEGRYSTCLAIYDAHETR